MGSFANSVFSVLLGWIRTAINQMWGAGQQRQRRLRVDRRELEGADADPVRRGRGDGRGGVPVPLAAHAGMGQLLPPPARQGRGGG